MKVVVASKNPTKVNAAREAFEKVFPDESWEIVGVVAESGVSAQPREKEETLLGARNRIKHSRELIPHADYWVGIEGGLDTLEDELECSAWVVVVDTKGNEGRSCAGNCTLPPTMRDMILEGKELAEATDSFFKGNNIREKEGFIGVMTNGLIDRTEYYVHPIIIALSRFKRKELYEA